MFEDFEVLGIRWTSSAPTSPETLQPPDALRPAERRATQGWNGNSEFFFRAASRMCMPRWKQPATATARSGSLRWAGLPRTTRRATSTATATTMEMQAQIFKRAIEAQPLRLCTLGWRGLRMEPELRRHLGARSAIRLHEQAAFGILNPDWSPRPSYTAIQNMPKP